VGQDGPPTAELAELRQALLEFHEALARPLLGQRRGRMARRLQRQGRRWLNAVLLLLLALDARGRPDGARVATAGATADRAELDAAAEVLVASHLGGRAGVAGWTGAPERMPRRTVMADPGCGPGADVARGQPPAM
jgi:hypothetical protein